MEVIGKYKEYLENEIDRCEKYLDNIAFEKCKYELKNNPNIEEVKFNAMDTSNPDYTADVFRQLEESLQILEFFNESRDKSVFFAYNILENSLKNSNLKFSEQIEIIKYFISINSSIFINYKNRYFFNVRKIENLKLKYLTKEEIRNLIDSNGVDILLNKKFLFGKRKRKQEELRKILPNILEDCTKEEIHKSIYYEFIEKKVMTEESINLFTKNLQKLGFTLDYCEKIKICLLKQIKEEKKEERKYNFNFNNKAKKEEISDEERNILKDVYDIDKQELKKFVSYTESLCYVKIMQKMGISKNDIIIFLKKIYANLNEQNPVTKYLELRNKLLYYKDKYSLSESINSMDDYLKELLNLSDNDFNESYDYWEDAINDELNKVLSYIPRDYEYELESKKVI